MENIIENTILIAQFDDRVIHANSLQVFFEEDIATPNGAMRDEYQIADTCYHTSWDWLMPVVNEIKLIGEIGERYYEALDRLDNCLMEVNIDAVYENLVDIIKWYNENKED